MQRSQIQFLVMLKADQTSVYAVNMSALRPKSVGITAFSLFVAKQMKRSNLLETFAIPATLLMSDYWWFVAG